MAINLTDSLNAATTKGKLGDAKQVYLNGDTKNLQQAYEETSTHFGTLDNRSTQMEKAIQDISVTGGASTANAVSYNNSTSKLEAITAQGAIDELANKKLNKENIVQELGDSKDKVVSQFALPFREIESPEFIKAIVDAEDHFLFGIQLDGSIEWGNGIPAPIRAKLQEIINQCKKDKTDILEAINAAKEELSASITALQEGKVDKEEGKSLIEDEVKECFRVIENEEFIEAIVDSDDKVLFGLYRATGKPYYPQNDMYHISQSEEFLWVILDTANHPLLGIQQDGTCWAAKAQWLDDIKAIKEALSSIDETLKTFQPKEDGKGLINLDVADSLFYISNDEYIIAVVDTENRILEGIKSDGTKVISGDIKVLGNMEVSGVLYKVIENTEYLAAWIDAEDKVIFGLKADGKTYIGDADFLNDIKNNQEAISEINAIIASISSTIEPLDIDALTSITATENPEFIELELDVNNKVLSGRKTDGTKFENNDVELNGNATVSGSLDVDGFVIKSIEDTKERSEITFDSEERIISYRKNDGTLGENVGIETPKIETEEIRLSEEGKAKLIKETNPHLRLDRIDIISTKLVVSENVIFPLTNSRNEVGDVDTDDVLFKYTSKNGGFIDNCVIAYQGNSSVRWAKKGFAVDLQNKHRFKNWIEHDSFNIKGYATDWMHVREYIGTTIYEQMMQHRPIGHRRPWELYNDFKDSDYQNGCPSSALGHSDQHPVELYINGNYWGLYSISLKKKKENYKMKKNNAKHIMLDADGFSCALDYFTWSGAEIRFPKEDKNKNKLLDKNLHKYDGDNPTELLGADNPLYDANNPTHVFCNTVKQKILTFYQFNHNIDNNTTKEQIEAHWNVEEFIDNYLQTNFIGNPDVGGKNTLYCTWDGVHWSPLAYDFDLTFGCGWTNGIKQEDVHLAFERYPARNEEDTWACIPGAAQIKALYKTDIETRYKELRDCGIFSAENVAKIIKDWMIEVGEDVYKDDLDRWDGVYGNRGTKNMHGEEDVECYVNQQALYDYVVARLAELDILFNYTSN